MVTNAGSKVLRIGTLNGGFTLDPMQAQDKDSLFVLRQVVEPPLTSDVRGQTLTPTLFTDDLVDEGGDSRVFSGRLRPGLRFSDGQPLDADTVVRCLSQVALVRDQATLESQGDRVVFHLKQPNARFDIALSHPQCSIYRMDGGTPLGTGAFQIAPPVGDEAVRLVRNPHHREPIPLDEIHVVVYPPDADGTPSALLEAIANGAVDYSSSLSRDFINTSSGVRKSILPGISTSILYLNSESPRLADPRTRRAIARSIDRVEVARTCYSNALAFTAHSLLPRALDPVEDSLTYDATAADEARKAGVPMPDKLTLLTIWGPRPYLPQPQRVIDNLTWQLGRIGIELETITTSSREEYGEKVIAGREDLQLSGWIADVMDPTDFLEANLASNRVPTAANYSVSANSGRLRSSAMDEALAYFRSDRNPTRLQRIMELLSEHAPLIPLTYGATTAVLSFRVKNFEPSPLGIQPLDALDLEE